jgi:hypothetical protein
VQSAGHRRDQGGTAQVACSIGLHRTLLEEEARAGRSVRTAAPSAESQGEVRKNTGLTVASLMRGLMSAGNSATRSRSLHPRDGPDWGLELLQ